MTSSPPLPPALAVPLDRLRRDLEGIFTERLRALVAHGPRVRCAQVTRGTTPPIATLALVDHLQLADLVACAQHAASWRDAGLAIPLLLEPREFLRSLDAFPIEYGDIIAHHVVVAGEDPFVGVVVADEDLRRACETWSKAHLIHLREGFIEAQGDARRVAGLVLASASPFTALLLQVARLRQHPASDPETLAQATEGIAGLNANVVRRVIDLEASPELDPDSAMALFPAYLDAVAQLVAYLDDWRQGSAS